MVRSEDSFAKNFKAMNKKIAAEKKGVVKAKFSIPKGSMAWIDAKNGPIITAERMRNITLPPSVCRMFAIEAKKLKQASPPSLLSLNVPPPSLLSILSPALPNVTPPSDEKQILDVLTRINTILRLVADTFSISLCACIERRTVDNAMCLFTYFEQIPWALIGGIVTIPEEFADKPPPPECLFDAWRGQFFQSLQFLIPAPIFNKMKRAVDTNVNMEWCSEVISGDDFHEMIQRIQKTKMNPMYSILWTTKPMDFDPHNQQFSNAKSALIRQMEAEVKLFWTYDRIGVYLTMYSN